MYHYVYKVLNLINGNYYIGKHSSRTLDNSYLGSGKYLKLAIEKYGSHNFKKEILHECETPEDASNLEREIIGDLWTTDSLCYNLKAGGEGGSPRGLKRSEETKQRISVGLTGMKHTEESKRNMTNGQRNRIFIFSEETLKKMSESKLGKKHSEETKQLISNQRKGFKFSEESIRKRVESRKRNSEKRI